MSKVLGWVVPALAILVAVLWLTGLGDGTSLLK